jgi:hypothetical protein
LVGPSGELSRDATVQRQSTLGSAMGILDLFRKDETVRTKVLICALDSRFEELMRKDSEAYKCCYPTTTATTLSEPNALLEAVRQGYDVIHLLSDVSPNGEIAGSDVTGTELIAQCCDSNVKLLWIASDNDPDGYIRGFKARGKRLNLVMTIKRNDPKFSEFLGKLLSKMSSGDSMPVAWNDLCPQIPGASHNDAPESIFFAGRPGSRLR